MWHVGGRKSAETPDGILLKLLCNIGGTSGVDARDRLFLPFVLSVIARAESYTLFTAGFVLNVVALASKHSKLSLLSNCSTEEEQVLQSCRPNRQALFFARLLSSLAENLSSMDCRVVVGWAAPFLDLLLNSLFFSGCSSQHWSCWCPGFLQWGQRGL